MIRPRRGCRRFTLGAVLAGLLLASLPACKATEKKKEEATPTEAQAQAQPAGDAVLETAELEQQAKSEFHAVMYGQHMEMARQHRNALELDRALTEVDHALGYEPSSDEALRLRAEIKRLLGDRAGETRTVIDDQFEAANVQREEQTITVKRLIADGNREMEAKEYDRADESYERALFIVNSAKLSPLGMDDALAKLGAEAEARKRELERLTAQAEAERDKLDTETALKKVAELEEKQLMEGRERRAKLLNSAIDAFNRESFELAENYAQQVLHEEPDNTVAHDLLENARRARHSSLGIAYLRDLKDSFRRWQTDIEATKVPSSKVLQWPSQAFWDRITAVRALRDAGGGGREMTAEEQALSNTLDTRRISLPFEDETAFPLVVDYLSATCGVNFVIDPRARDVLDAVTITLQADDVDVRGALDLILLQASGDGAIVYEISGNVVRFIRKENAKRDMTLRVHPVADLTLGLTDFIPPDITQVVVSEESETPLFGGVGEEATQPYGTIEELAELVRASVSPETWEAGGSLSPHGRNLVVYAPPEVQDRVRGFLEDLRRFAHVVVTIEGRILRVGDAFLRDVGVDIRGIGGSGGGPLATLDDVTNGLVNNASAGIDNSGPGVGSGGAALNPSSGLYFNDGTDGDVRARTENIFPTPLGSLLTGLGGGTFQVTYLDDLAVSAVVRATEKSANMRRMRSPTVTVYNSQRAYISSLNQVSYIADFDVEVAQTAFIADPVIGIIQEGIVLDVRPVASDDLQYVTLEIGTATIDLRRPIEKFTTNVGQAGVDERGQGARPFAGVVQPVSVQLPELEEEITSSTARVPNGGSVLLSGLKSIKTMDQQATTPILGNIPVLSFLFSRRGKSEEVVHRMAIITATATELHPE